VGVDIDQRKGQREGQDLMGDRAIVSKPWAISRAAGILTAFGFNDFSGR
jgi:hypothetical protein